MHPAFIWYWKRRLYGADPCSATFAGCGPGYGGYSYRRRGRGSRDSRHEFRTSGRRSWDDDLVFGAGSLGVRRPLRFMASRLDLSEEQFGRAAKILEDLKIERAQATVDLRRASADFAEAIEGGEFGREQAESASRRRIEAARRVQEAVSRALEQLHALLEPDQREELATLIRSGGIRL
ncbi:MAG: Spy/CpxP family protein refolding chaperone [Myxococcota bacterium]|nr:Spy/CpxP family protein refolding chaperone [Myxococcota bacterium]